MKTTTALAAQTIRLAKAATTPALASTSAKALGAGTAAKAHVEKERATWKQVASKTSFDGKLMKALTPLTERMLDRLQLAPGQHVLDMAAGTGEPSIPAARRVGPEGRVVATDLVEEMIDFAKAKAAKQGIANLELRVANAETLDVGGERFDAVSMRAGIMFMLDPDAAMRNAHAALKPGGRVAISAWAAPDKNLWISSPIGVLKQHVPMPPQQPGAPGPFAFANPERLRSVLADAGFTNVEVEAVELSMAKFPSGSAYVDFLKEMPGPIAMLLGKLPPEKRAQVEAEIATKAQSASGEVDLEGVHWVASAQKAA